MAESAAIPAAARTHKFVTLDGLRGVAALAVATIHSPEFFPHLHSSSYLAVDFFFLLSGFVVANAYEEKLKGPMSTRAFVLIRMIRLYPLYLAGMLLGLSAVLIQIARGEDHTALDSLAAFIGFGVLLLPVPPPLSADPYPLNGPSWSLFLEIMANLVYAVTLPWLSSRVLATVVALAAVAVAFAGVHFGTLHVGWLWSHAWGGLARVTFSFFLGVLLFRLRKPRTLPQPAAWLVMALLPALLMCSPGPKLQAAYDIALVLLVFPPLLLVAAASPPGRAAKPLFQVLGLTSYAIYVFHASLYIYAHGVAKALGLLRPQYALGIGVGFLVLLVAVTWLVDLLYDQPVRRWLTRRAFGSSKPPL